MNLFTQTWISKNDKTNLLANLIENKAVKHLFKKLTNHKVRSSKLFLTVKIVFWEYFVQSNNWIK